MTEQVTPRRFHEAKGVEDWRVLFGGVCAHFRTGSFAAGIALVDAIGRLADAADRHPDVDLRYMICSMIDSRRCCRRQPDRRGVRTVLDRTAFGHVPLRNVTSGASPRKHLSDEYDGF